MLRDVRYRPFLRSERRWTGSVSRRVSEWLSITRSLPHTLRNRLAQEEGHGKAGSSLNTITRAGRTKRKPLGPDALRGPGSPVQKKTTHHAIKLELGFYIDHFGIVMFAMVTFIATLIHLFATGYMADETQRNGRRPSGSRHRAISAAAAALAASSCSCRCSASRCST